MHTQKQTQTDRQTERCTHYGKQWPGATFHYEFCCYFPQNARTLQALESSIFNGIACRLLRLSDIDLCTTLG